MRTLWRIFLSLVLLVSSLPPLSVQAIPLPDPAIRATGHVGIRIDKVRMGFRAAPMFRSAPVYRPAPRIVRPPIVRPQVIRPPISRITPRNRTVQRGLGAMRSGVNPRLYKGRALVASPGLMRRAPVMRSATNAANRNRATVMKRITVVRSNPRFVPARGVRLNKATAAVFKGIRRLARTAANDNSTALALSRHATANGWRAGRRLSDGGGARALVVSPKIALAANGSNFALGSRRSLSKNPAIGSAITRLESRVAHKARTTAFQTNREYPGRRGFLGIATKTTLRQGATFDRYGDKDGRFAAPQGTSTIARSLHPKTDVSNLHRFRVLKPFEVYKGTTAPYYGKPGGGTQYFFGKRSIDQLENDGYIEYLK